MTTVVEDRDILEALNDMAPEEILLWAADTHGDRAAIITSFQDTGMVAIDMAHRAGANLRVATLDTLRLHPETYELMDRIEKRYGIEIERQKPDPERIKKMIEQHGEYLFFDSKYKQEFCCRVRKVEPNEEILKTLDVWITGLRTDQSESRKKTPKGEMIDAPRERGQTSSTRKILKISPLVDWTHEQVWEYITEHDVPYNPLYDQRYTSIGCIICSTPTMPWEDKRAGRWRWFKEEDAEAPKECGIHVHGSGI